MSYANILKLKNRFNSLSAKNDLKEAVKVGDLIIDEYFSSRLTNSRKFADDIFDIAVINDKSGNLARAEQLYKESANVYKNICGKDIGYAHRINNLAIIYAKTFRNVTALSLFKESYRLKFNLLGYKSSETGAGLYNLGNAYYDSGDYERALHYLRQALKSWDKRSEDYIDNVNSIGYTLEALGALDKALEQFHIALDLIAEVYGVLSMEYIKNLYYIANVYYENGDYEKSKDYMELFITITTKIIGEKHPYILKALECLSQSCKCLNDDASELEYRLKIIKLTEENIGCNHIFYCECLSSAAVLYKRKCNYQAAEKLLEKSLDIRMGLTGFDNISYLKDLILLAGIHFEMGMIKETIREISAVVEIVENNNELFDGVLIEMIHTFIEVDDRGLTQEEKQQIFDNIYRIITDDESGNGFNWRMFDDFR